MSGYVIQVGFHKPQQVEVGTVDPKTGRPVGETIKVHKQVGNYQIINRCRVWARRVLPDGKVHVKDGVEVQVELLDPQYRGKLEFLPWGSDKVGAQAIELRYLKQSTTLDYEYQTTVQRIQTRVEDGTDFIMLSPGENKFDYKADALFIQMLKVHPQNRGSVSKNPDPQFKGHTYWEVNDENVDKTDIKNEEAALDAGGFVRGFVDKEASLQVILSVVSQYEAAVENSPVEGLNNLSNPSDVYKGLLKFARIRPNDFLSLISNHKANVRRLFDFAESSKNLDLSKSGHIGLRVKDKTELVFTGLPEEIKGKKMIDWVVDNWTEPEVAKAITGFKTLIEAEAGKIKS